MIRSVPCSPEITFYKHHAAFCRRRIRRPASATRPTQITPVVAGSGTVVTTTVDDAVETIVAKSSGVELVVVKNVLSVSSKFVVPTLL
jgi:hypothetical protein